MRLITTLAWLVFSVAYTGNVNTSNQSNNLNGNWIPVKQEIGGTSLPASVFEKQKLIINDSNYTFTAESVDKGVIQYKDSTMDIYGREGINAGKHLTAIYKYQNNQLTICYNLKGDSYPTAFETSAGPTFFLSVFEKEISK